MKKLAVLKVGAAVMASGAGLYGGSKAHLRAEKSSHFIGITERNPRCAEMMGTFTSSP